MIEVDRGLTFSDSVVLPHHHLSTYDHRAFSVAGPTVCNSLPSDLWDPECSSDIFRQLRKMFLFWQYYCV